MSSINLFNRSIDDDSDDSDIDNILQLEMDEINERKRKKTFRMNLSTTKKPKTEWAAAYNNSETFSNSCACCIMNRSIYLSFPKSIQYESICDHKPITCYFPLEGDSRLLNIAIKYNDIKLMEKLFETGTSPNCQDDLGHTPLHYAIHNNYKQMICLLFFHGANPNIRCAHNKTPIKMALELKKIDIAYLIKTCCKLKKEITRKRLLLLLLLLNRRKGVLDYLIEKKTNEEEKVINLTKKSKYKTDVNHNIACKNLIEIKTDEEERPINLTKEFLDYKTDINHNERLLNHCKNLIEIKTDEEERPINLTKKFLDYKTDVNHNKRLLNHCKNPIEIKTDEEERPINLTKKVLDYKTDVNYNEQEALLINVSLHYYVDENDNNFKTF